MWKWNAWDPRAVMVMIHGAGEHHGRYKWLIEKWRSNGFHVVMGDLPGQGMSSRKRGHIQSFDEYIQEVDHWLREAQTFELPVFLLGHSMGGLVAIRTLQTIHFPLKGVILSSPCLGLIHKPNKVVDWVSKGLNVFAPSMRFDSNLTAEIATRNQEILDASKNDSLLVKKVSVRWYRELVNAMEQAFEEALKLPDIPLLVMQGGEDKIVDKNSVKKWFNQLDLTDKSYKEWKGLYHEIFNEPEREFVFDKAFSFANEHIAEV